MNNQNYTYGITGVAMLDVARNYLLTMDPDDNGNYAVMRPGVVERYRHNDYLSSNSGMNRAYGILKNIYLIYTTLLSNFLDGKTIGGKDYVFIQLENLLFNSGSASYSVLFLETESTS